MKTAATYEGDMTASCPALTWPAQNQLHNDALSVKCYCITLSVKCAAPRPQQCQLQQTYCASAFVSQTRSSADADNRLDVFSGQSRSTNMVPFHMLHIVSYCAIATLSLRRAVFTIFVFKNFMTLKWGSKVIQGHWEWYHSIDCVWFPISVL